MNSNIQKNYFCVSRKFLFSDTWLSEPFTRAQAWIDLIGLANYKTSTLTKRGISITIKRGQVSYSQNQLAKRWRWSRGKIKRYLRELEEKNNEQIQQQKTPLMQLITIVNYDSYQPKRTANGHQSFQTRSRKKPEKNIFDKKPTEGRTPESDLLLVIKQLNRRLLRLETDTRRTPDGHQTDTRRTPNDTTITKKVKKEENIKKTNKKKIQGNNCKKYEKKETLDGFMQRYNNKLLILNGIDHVRKTRKSKKISDSIIFGMFRSWEKYDIRIVEKAIETYINSGYASKGMNEKYLLGIMRGKKKEVEMKNENRKNKAARIAQKKRPEEYPETTKYEWGGQR